MKAAPFLRHSFGWWLAGLSLVLHLGCGFQKDSGSRTSSDAPVVANTEAASPEEPAPKAPETPRTDDESARETAPEPTLRKVNAAEDLAVSKIKAVITDSVDLGPTLVVWLLDRTPSAGPLVREVKAAVQNLYESPQVAEWSAGDEKRLSTAIATFDAEAQFALDPPTDDVQQVVTTLDGVASSSSGREMTFTAIKKTLEKYLPLRTGQQRELVVVVVTGEVGDDPDIAEELLETTRRHAIALYVIGLPAPWGQINPLAKNPNQIGKAGDDSTPTFGPESLVPERVDIVTGSQAARPADNKLVDSGFGPFALERLCRASRGQFVAVRPARGSNSKTWPTGNELRIDESVVSKYAPDYVLAADYQKLLSENKARAALVEAAKLSPVVLEGAPGTRFAREDEAKMAKKLSQAQQFAARNLPGVERLCDLLLKGEEDRARLTSQRWQAQYDLAMGRALAHKARLDGYNSMIALLKRGKTFQNADSKAWVLKPADNFETESTIRRTADKAKMYLERVVKDHPGTPWAKIAEDELKSPLGWTWTESK